MLTPASPQVADALPEMEIVVPLSLQVMLQPEEAAPTEQLTPSAASVPHRQMVSSFSVAVQHAGAADDPEQPRGSARRSSKEERSRMVKVRMSFTLRLWPVVGNDGSAPPRRRTRPPEKPFPGLASE